MQDKERRFADGGGEARLMDGIAELLNLNEEQRRVLNSEARRRAVSAGAGTGKTRLLVACCLAELEAGADIDSIVAITFTENAAAELKRRLEDAVLLYLERFGERGGINARTAAGIRGARIGTIHGLAMGIVRENLALTPFPAGFEIGEPAELRADRERAVLETVLALRGDGDFDELLETELFNLDAVLENISAIIEAASRKHLPLPLPPPRLTEAPDGGDINGMIEAGESVFSSAAAKRRFQKAKDLAAGGSGTSCRDFVRMAGEMEKVLEMKTASAEEKAAAGGMARRAVWEADILNVRLTERYLKAAGAAMERYAEIKARGGRAEYEDLLFCAARVLEENRTAREHYGGLFKLVVVDEFQDTDPLQNRIITLLCEGGAKLLVVGDILQSIYGFRGAETGLFLQTLGGGEFEAFRLPVNYRAAGQLLDFLNRFFENIVSGYEPMKAAGRRGGVFRALPARGKSADEKRRSEAEDIAREIGGLAAEGRRYSDIALIFRRRANTGVYGRALARAGIPFTTGGEMFFFSLPEVRDMVSMLRFMANPLDETAQAAVLRSPFFGIPDAGLARYFREKKSAGAGFFRSPPHGGEEWEEAARYLASVIRAGEREDFSSPAAAARFAAYRLGYAACAAGDGGRVRSNVIKFTAICAALARKGVGTAGAVSRFDAGKNDPRPESAEEERDAVSLITSHGAKGLEFPVVFLADTDYGPVSRRGRVAADSSQIMVCHEGCNAGRWREIAGAGEAEEEERILYVALTRASGAVFTRLHETPKAGSFAAMVKTALEKMADSGGEYGDMPAPAPPPETAGAETPPSEATAETLRPLYEPGEDEAEETPPFCAVAKTETGEVIHRFFELWDFSPESIGGVADFVIGERFFGRDGLKSGITRCARNVLRSPLAEMAANARSARREYEFTVETGGAARGGKIDLLLETDEGMVVVDYKYTDSSDVGKYEEQMDFYCAAIEKIHGQKPARRYICILPPADMIEI
ncbi:MAG: UvrD-helicase domain-containing protein [Candidatus Dadabacteria bacterium]|nr:UvrD-helicase domain-containing protein [Candidatus Dadabacteria bacterium]